MISSCTASVPVNLPAEVVFAVLTDYDAYEQWMPGVSHSRILASEGDIALAEFVWPEILDDKSVLEFIHSPPFALVYTQTNAPGRRLFSGRWDITATPDRGGVVLSAQMRLQTSWYSTLSNRRRLRAVLRGALDAVGERAQAVACSPGNLAAGKVKILEVIKGKDSLRVWILGERYELKPSPEEDSP